MSDEAHPNTPGIHRAVYLRMTPSQWDKMPQWVKDAIGRRMHYREGDETIYFALPRDITKRQWDALPDCAKGQRKWIAKRVEETGEIYYKRNADYVKPPDEEVSEQRPLRCQLLKCGITNGDETSGVNSETGEKQTPRMWLRYRWSASNTNAVSHTEDALRKIVAMRATSMDVWGPYMPLRGRWLLVRAFSRMRRVSIYNAVDDNVFAALCAAIRHPDSCIEELSIHSCDRIDDVELCWFWGAAATSKRLRLITTDDTRLVVGLRQCDTLEAVVFSRDRRVWFDLLDGMLRKFPALRCVTGITNETWEFRAAWSECGVMKDSCGRRVVVRTPEMAPV